MIGIGKRIILAVVVVAARSEAFTFLGDPRPLIGREKRLEKRVTDCVINAPVTTSNAVRDAGEATTIGIDM
jgi:hypothetical protein